MALAAFAVAVLAGLSVGNPSQDIVLRAIISMLICQVVGMVIGMMGERIVNDHAVRYVGVHPVPETTEADAVLNEWEATREQLGHEK